MADQVTGLLSPWLRKRRLRRVRAHLSGRVLDFGCGVGELARFVSPDSYVGLDSDAASLAEARSRFPHHSFVETIPKNSEKFDRIVMLAVLEHIAAPQALLGELKSLLKPQGAIVLTTPHPWTRRVHRWGAKVHLFSRSAEEEHEKLLGKRRIEEIAARAGLKVHRYRRFLLGFNQFVVLKP